MYEQYEDGDRPGKQAGFRQKTSPFCDLVYYDSSVTKGLRLAARVLKPERPGYILATTHGWHMSIPEFEERKVPYEELEYLTVEVDMRGRAFSSGRPDCNGLELFDVIDAVEMVKQRYGELVRDPRVVYFEGGSGGGGNAYAIVGKFPDFFAACTALCGISDYELWYRNDRDGEFRDEMDVWIGCSPEENPMAYRARSGLHLLENLRTPLFAAHGEKDLRVPAEQARVYMERGKSVGKHNLLRYLELPGVGTRAHWGNATGEQMEMVRNGSEENRRKNRRPVDVPESGSLIVGGYVVTKKVSVRLDSQDKVAVLDYDLKRKEFAVRCNVECEYTIEEKCST